MKEELLEVVDEHDPIVGDMVHMIVGGKCFAALIVDVSAEGVVTLRRFVPFSFNDPGDTMAEPYVSLDSARPTSGWHWIYEHE